MPKSEPELDAAEEDAAAVSKSPPNSSPTDAASGSNAKLERTCGTCTECCTIMGVPELKKRPWEKCPHVVGGAGCSIYAERPVGCRRFMCGWLLDPAMGPELKPEECHVMLYERGEQHIVASCHPAYPDAWRRPDVIGFLHRLAKAVSPARRVLLMEQDKLWYVTEDAVVPTDRG